MRLAICNGKPAYQATTEERTWYQDAIHYLYEKAKSHGWYPMEEIHEPSSTNPHKDIGDWRVSYGDSSKPEENMALRVLYEAFPVAHPNLGMIVGTDWVHAQLVVETELLILKGKNGQHAADVEPLETVLETINYVLSQADHEAYFLDWGP
jgi:hypothetical protein